MPGGTLFTPCEEHGILKKSIETAHITKYPFSHMRKLIWAFRKIIIIKKYIKYNYLSKFKV